MQDLQVLVVFGAPNLGLLSGGPYSRLARRPEKGSG